MVLRDGAVAAAAVGAGVGVAVHRGLGAAAAAGVALKFEGADIFFRRCSSICEISVPRLVCIIQETLSICQRLDFILRAEFRIPSGTKLRRYCSFLLS